MARLFDGTLAKDCFHAVLQSGIASDGRMFAGMPIDIRNWESALCCLWTKYLEREREMEMKYKAEDV
jgi:hypothetical protein